MSRLPDLTKSMRIYYCLTLLSRDVAMTWLLREAWKKWKVRHEADNIHGPATACYIGK
jgi:hypothetical protein